MAAKFLRAVLTQLKVKRLISSDHFSGDAVRGMSEAAQGSGDPKDRWKGCGVVDQELPPQGWGRR